LGILNGKRKEGGETLPGEKKEFGGFVDSEADGRRTQVGGPVSVGEGEAAWLLLKRREKNWKKRGASGGGPGGGLQRVRLARLQEALFGRENTQERKPRGGGEKQASPPEQGEHRTVTNVRKKRNFFRRREKGRSKTDPLSSHQRTGPRMIRS